MAKKKTIAPKKRGYKKSNLPSGKDIASQYHYNNVSSFDIEESPPPARFRGTNVETMTFLARIDTTIKSLKPGNAFIIPAQQKATARKHLTREYPERLFVINPVVNNDSVFRVYFIRYLAKSETK